MTDKVKIRAKSTLNFVTLRGNEVTYEYPPTCSVDEIANDALFVVYMNKGADGCRELLDNMLSKLGK